MDIKIFPGKLKGVLTPPPSKSYLHRAIISASLAKGTSYIRNILIGDDIQATIEAFRSLGITIDYYNNQLTITSNGSLSIQENHQIQCHESGSTLRFLMPLLTTESGVEFYGTSSLLNRPLSIYEAIYANQNNEFVRFQDHIYLQGTLKADHFHIDDDSSSQYVSGLLFALPRLPHDSTISITKDFQSKHYIDMTISILNQFGIIIHQTSETTYQIPGNQTYHPQTIHIESDYSQASFFLIGAAMNGDLTLNHLYQHSLQPDKSILHILKQAGIPFHVYEQSIHIQQSTLDLPLIDLSQNIDLGPALFLLASQSKSPTIIKNYERLMYKESNRLSNMLDILKMMNVNVIQSQNTIKIGFQPSFTFGTIDSYHDHRIAMAIAIFATKATTPTIIKNIHVINKSYPTFIHDLKQLGIQVSYLTQNE